MTTFPHLTHVALTVRDLTISVPWYRALFDTEPVMDEDTEPDMHHTVFMIGNNTLVGLHQHADPGTIRCVQRVRRRTRPRRVWLR